MHWVKEAFILIWVARMLANRLISCEHEHSHWQLNKNRRSNALVCLNNRNVTSQCIFIVIAQLASSHLILTHSGNSSDRAENSKAYVWAVRRIVVALASQQDNMQWISACLKTPTDMPIVIYLEIPFHFKTLDIYYMYLERHRITWAGFHRMPGD